MCRQNSGKDEKLLQTLCAMRSIGIFEEPLKVSGVDG